MGTTVKVTKTTQQGSSVEIMTPSSVPTTTSNIASSPASPSTTSSPASVIPPTSTTFCKDGEVEENVTICHSCKCRNKAWICETFCNQTCTGNELLIKKEGACCFCSALSTTSGTTITGSTCSWNKLTNSGISKQG